MSESNDRIKDLIIRHLKDELTIQEQLELSEWVEISEDNRTIFQQLTDPDDLNKDIQEYFEAKANVWDKVEAGINTPAFKEGLIPAIRPATRRIRVYLAAASLLFIIITGYFWLHSQLRSPSKARSVLVPVAVRDVAPGGNKATLTLGNGSTIILENAANGSIAVQGTSHVSKDKNSLSYIAASSPVAPAIVYNTLTTPRAGQFKVVLPDGTKVWLNNASSLRYPTSFTGASRVVELTGEAYFEVARHSAQPFSVRLPAATVQVLGTSFNVMAYNDEPEIKATLLEGSVSVTKANQTLLLHPGQQAHVKSNIHIENANIGETIAWKNNLFEFNSADIETVMRVLGRAYDLDFKFEGVKTNQRLTGIFRRDSFVSDVLQILTTSGYHFRIDGKTIIVLP